MNTYYYIFKTDNLTGKTVHICNGSHDSAEDCFKHFRIYSYGFMDAADTIYGRSNYQMMDGSLPNSFHFSVDGKVNVDFFMLLDKEGQDLIMELCKD